ncbi:hypothetical protein LPTSP3_g11600 [Leptospira kobayashii]|uniref:Fibronectin type-III domain-containing protein n=1 Tax=Leptospira kobayashii TaxID=1917830 RepID=A0ABM7UHR5_9LEPT|nr:DUF1554 domain-containing protein [Leptospira kobayashii]BDA78230.1 hypothetical protein LPTSP3_g11600 [Leptospira kobayashii]
MRKSKNLLIIVCFVLIFTACQKLEFDNAQDFGNKSYLATEELKCLLGQVSVLCPSSRNISAPEAPTIQAGNTQNTLSWKEVTGATSYAIYYGTTTGVSKTNGIRIANISSPYTHSSIVNNTSYYYILVAVNASGESNASSEATATPVCSPCKMFLTATTYTAALSGISGADSKCQIDANKPTTPSASIYKSLIVDATNRIACTSSNCATSGLAEHKDWVLKPNTTYIRAADSVSIGAADSLGLLVQTADISSAGTLTVWTGLSTGGDWLQHGTGSCSLWTGTGGAGQASSTNIKSNGGGSCGSFNVLACVEQ